MKIVSSSEMAKIDERAQSEFNIPSVLLMENAAVNAFKIISEKIIKEEKTKRIIFIAGKGNNAGDCLAISRHAHNFGYKNIKIFLCTKESGELAGKHLEICRKLGIEISVIEQKKANEIFKDCDYIVDGIFGTGLKGRIKPEYDFIFEALNNSNAKKISLDIPSGLSDFFKTDFPAVKADYTITFGLPKNCLYFPAARTMCGEIFFADAGFPAEILNDEKITGRLLDINDFFRMLPRIGKDAYKNKKGNLAIFAGSKSSPGAGILSSLAASRTRSGLVTIFVNEEIYTAIASQLKSVIVKSVNEFDGNSNYTGWLLGPGWSKNSLNKKIMHQIIGKENSCGVLDADGLNILAEAMNEEKIDFKASWVLTPHPGEFLRLSNITKEELLENPLPHIEALSKKLNCVIVLKSHVVFIMCPDGHYSIIDGMNPAMATGGSGDVLSGIIASFIASGINPKLSAELGVILHQAAGRMLFSEKGWFTSDDLIDYIPKVLKGL